MSKLDKLHSLVPLEEIEQGAKDQIYDILDLDCLKSLAIMPDVHQGFDMPIGGIALLDGYISPSFVGVDIGCGMCHINTGLTTFDLFHRKREMQDVYDAIMKQIPTGFSSHTAKRIPWNFYNLQHLPREVSSRIKEKVSTQLGTLGGGNHFIEIGENAEGEIGVTIHSGSRNVGHTIGEYYISQGRMFPIESDIGRSYFCDMCFALEFALENRKHMMIAVLSILGFDAHTQKPFFEQMINENHNHAIVTPNGVLHRKGATSADKNQLGIIPANMRDGVYITKGLGNEKYLSSASHGCGRVMGRNQAKKKLDLQAFQDQMVGVVCTADRSTLDEAPDAYKDVNYVLEAQRGIVVDIVDHFKPLISVKAGGKE